MPRRPGSVQTLLPLDDVVGDVIRLRGGEYRAVLEAGSVNFALKSEAEQEAIFAGYRRFLNALAYPVQVLLRITPTDIEVYLGGLRAAARGRDGELWTRLARDHEAFVRRLARERSLLDRQCYVVIPAATTVTAGAGRGWLRRRGRGEREGSTLLAAQRSLAFRCAEIGQGLAAFGVPTRRLDGSELTALWRVSLAGVPLTSGVPAPPRTPVWSVRPADATTRGALDA